MFFFASEKTPYIWDLFRSLAFLLMVEGILKSMDAHLSLVPKDSVGTFFFLTLLKVSN